MMFTNRRFAGKKLAEHLKDYSFENPVVIALARGGVPVGYEVARALKLPFDVLVVRKVGAPGNPEYGIGAMTEDGYCWIDENSARAVGATESDIEAANQTNSEEIQKRVKQYRNNRQPLSVEGKTVLLVDDGIATGITARVASTYLKKKGAKDVYITVPVTSRTMLDSLERNQNENIIYLAAPENFYSVGQYYDDFSQVSDEEVSMLIDQAKENLFQEEQSAEISAEVMVNCGLVQLPGFLTIPHNCKGIVIFAHGSGSSRLSPRNNQVAAAMNRAGLGTLLFDLLTQAESQLRENIFDIPLLANRIREATGWVRSLPQGRNTPIGYFGASTGAAAAFWAAADPANNVAAIVSRGGRPDLASSRLFRIRASTLLIVGSYDLPVLELNQYAAEILPNAQLAIVPKASHLFEEPGALEEVCRLSIEWFSMHFAEQEPTRAAA